MARVGWNEDLLARCGPMRHALDLELDVALDDDDDLVDVVHVVGPDLARRIDPEPAREAALAPTRGNGLTIDAALSGQVTTSTGTPTCTATGVQMSTPSASVSMLTTRA